MEIDGSLYTFAFGLCFLEAQEGGAGNQGGKVGKQEGVQGADVAAAASPVDPGSRENPDSELSSWKC